LRLVITIQDLDVFSAIQFCVNEIVMCEKIVFAKSENITNKNYILFHDDSIHNDTVFVRHNTIINILNYGINMRRLVKC